jgi:hypothetical protein
MTDLRKSQTFAEVWVTVADPDTVVTQMLAEGWVRQIPATALVVSQFVTEVWVPVPHIAPLRLSAQVI